MGHVLIDEIAHGKNQVICHKLLTYVCIIFGNSMLDCLFISLFKNLLFFVQAVLVCFQA
jgi:hypothetical protein